MTPKGRTECTEVAHGEGESAKQTLKDSLASSSGLTDNEGYKGVQCQNSYNQDRQGDMESRCEALIL